jgi:hypothetical protein
MTARHSFAEHELLLQTAKSSDVFKITASTLQKLLAALNECTEWGQARLPAGSVGEGQVGQG